MKFGKPKRSIKLSNSSAFIPQSRALIMVFTIIVLTFLLSLKQIWKPVYEVNQIAENNIYAQKNFQYKDENSTNELINEVIASIKPTLKKDLEVTTAQEEALAELLQTVSDVKQATKEDPYYNKGTLSTDVQNYIFSMNQSQWESKIVEPSLNLLAQMLSGGIPDKYTKESLYKDIYAFLPPALSPLEEKAIAQILIACFYPDNNIKFASIKIDSISEKSKKKLFIEYYENYLKANISNSKWLRKKVYRVDPDKSTIYLERIVYFLRLLEVLRSMKKLNTLVYKVLPSDIQQPARVLTEEQIWEAKELALNTQEQLLTEGISKEEIDFLPKTIKRYMPDNLLDEQQVLILNTISRVTKPNVVIDKSRLEELKNEAIKNVKPIYIQYKKGEILVKKGHLIDKDKYDLLVAAGLVDTKTNWNGVYETFSFVTLVAFIFFIYLYVFEKDLYFSNQNQAMFCVLLICCTIVSTFISSSYQQFIPIPVFAGILAMFINQRFALISIFFVLTLFFNSYDLTSNTILSLIAGSVSAVFILPKVTQRINILKSGIIIALVQVITYHVSTILLEIPNVTANIESTRIVIDSALWFASGIIFSMVILAVLPLIEEFFGLISYSRLMELGDFNQPLLRELEEKAPGTFQHSIAVSTLTEFAARKLNLDSTFCRVGAYYHDIGKMLKPYYFIENQGDGTNPHDELNDPYQSAKIIISHARAGVCMARKNKLPESIVNFMLEHHGTGLVSYFFYKAKQASDDPTLIEEDHFRYFGPKPQSKETAITMIADSAEAAVRSIKYKNRDSIRNKIQDIVAEKINDGQLSESGLTTDEIAIVIDSFTTVLLEIYHKRIEYPQDKKN